MTNILNENAFLDRRRGGYGAGYVMLFVETPRLARNAREYMLALRFLRFRMAAVIRLGVGRVRDSLLRMALRRQAQGPEVRLPALVVFAWCMAVGSICAAADGGTKWRVDESRAAWTIEAHGYYAVTGLTQNAEGLWQARAWQYGRLSIVQVDQQGNFDVVTVEKPDAPPLAAPQ